MAVKIYRPSDRVAVQIGEVRVTLSPLSGAEKMEISAYKKKVENEWMPEEGKMVASALKCAVKGIEGIEFQDGESFVPTFDSDGRIDDDSLTCLFEAAASTPLANIAQVLLYKRMQNLNDISGVKMLKPKKKVAK